MFKSKMDKSIDKNEICLHIMKLNRIDKQELKTRPINPNHDQLRVTPVKRIDLLAVQQDFSWL